MSTFLPKAHGIIFQCECFLFNKDKISGQFYVIFSAGKQGHISVGHICSQSALTCCCLSSLFSLPPQVSCSPVYWRLEFPTIDGNRKPVVWALNQFSFCSSKARFWPWFGWKLLETLHTEMQLICILALMAFANPAVLAGDVVTPECVPFFPPHQICSSDAFSSVSVNSVSLAKYKLFNRNEMCCHRSQKFEVMKMIVSVPCSDFCSFWELLGLHSSLLVQKRTMGKNNDTFSDGNLPWVEMLKQSPKWGTGVKTFSVLLPLQPGL